MAERARLIPPPPTSSEEWKWHALDFTSLPVKTLAVGDRRFEAESYLADGFGIKVAIAAKESGWIAMAKLAPSVLPNRLKGIVVPQSKGVPYMAATQALDFRPIGRRWLAADKIKNRTELEACPGDVLVTRSGSVGKAILAFKAHAGFVVSDDLLRVRPAKLEHRGWVYAFLRSRHARKMMTAAHYGHIIKHLEPAHLDSVPVPMPDSTAMKQYSTDFDEILRLRNTAFEKLVEAENLYEKLFKLPAKTETEKETFTANSRDLFKNRRLDGSFHNIEARSVEAVLAGATNKLERLGELVERVVVPGRFKHVYGEQGIPYLDSADLLECGPVIEKRVLSLDEKRRTKYMTKAGAILMPCSGQVHGNIGHVILATKFHAEKVLSNHILRVEPKSKSPIRMGYLMCVLGHPRLGRPLVLRTAFGSSVPEIGPDDIANIQVPRFDEEAEGAIAELIEEAARLRSKADELEEAIAERADAFVTSFLAHTSTSEEALSKDEALSAA